MEKVISEVIIGFVFLALLVSVIPMYRTNAEIVSELAAQADYNEKVKEIIKPDIPENGTVTGSDVIAAIRYYYSDENVGIIVTGKSGMHIYTDSDYNENIYEIKRDGYFNTRKTVSKESIVYYFTEGS